MIKVRLKGDLLSEFNTVMAKAETAKIKQCVEALKEATPVDTGKARDGWYSSGKTIKNDVEYVEYLNEGSSQQAPSHFIESTLLSQKGIRPSGTIVK